MAVDDNTPDVTTDDQQLINRFSCLNMKNAELKASIQLKNVSALILNKLFY